MSFSQVMIEWLLHVGFVFFSHMLFSSIELFGYRYRKAFYSHLSFYLTLSVVMGTLALVARYVPNRITRLVRKGGFAEVQANPQDRAQLRINPIIVWYSDLKTGHQAIAPKQYFLHALTDVMTKGMFISMVSVLNRFSDLAGRPLEFSWPFLPIVAILLLWCVLIRVCAIALFR